MIFLSINSKRGKKDNFKRLTLLGVILSALLLGACGSKDDGKEEVMPAAAEEKQDNTEALKQIPNKRTKAKRLK
jgi:PBP1b-binding outer membrane lipoprotein LpoB